MVTVVPSYKGFRSRNGRIYHTVEATMLYPR
jgi:hypothetical protein